MNKHFANIHIELPLFYEDKYLLVAYKPSGIIVHSQPPFAREWLNLVNILDKQIGRKPKPINRLDKGTSGIVLFGFGKKTISYFKDVWNTDKVTKKYLALTIGNPGDGTFTDPLENRNKKGHFQEAETCFKTIKNNGVISLVEIEIKTGRYHQIRRHFSMNSYPIIGDYLHGDKEFNRKFERDYHFQRLALINHELKFLDLKNNQHQYSIDVPTDLKILIDSF